MFIVPYSFFLELQKANDSYQEHLTAGSTSDQTMFSLSWDVQELKNIDSECRQVYSELHHCLYTRIVSRAEYP